METSYVDGLLHFLDSRFWPPWVILLWARSAIVLGSILLLIAVVTAVAHYFLGRPITVVNTQTLKPLTGVGLQWWLFGMAGGGALFLTLGIFKHP